MTFLINSSLGVIIDCDFKTFNSFYGAYYTCTVKNLHVTINDRDIKDVQGQHVMGKTNDDVKQFFVKHQNCLFIPLGIEKFFPNLELLYIMQSNLQFIMNGDLQGLNKLKIFDGEF
jgi:hypothetical protein